MHKADISFCSFASLRDLYHILPSLHPNFPLLISAFCFLNNHTLPSQYSLTLAFTVIDVCVSHNNDNNSNNNSSRHLKHRQPHLPWLSHLRRITTVHETLTNSPICFMPHLADWIKLRNHKDTVSYLDNPSSLLFSSLPPRDSTDHIARNGQLQLHCVAVTSKSSHNKSYHC